MTKIEYIKATLDLIKLGLSGFLGGFFLNVFVFYTEESLNARIILLIPLFIIAFCIIFLVKEYAKKMEELK